jgi:peroxiredoxin
VCLQPAASSALAPGVYRAVITLPGGELPINITVAENRGLKIVTIHNGAEALNSTELEERGRGFVLRFPGYENRIEAVHDARGYSGEVVMMRRGGVEVRLPFHAVAGEGYRFSRTPMAHPPSVAGRWAVTFTGKDGKESPAVAELTQNGAHVVGTILDPTGDHRFLEGEVDGDELKLSRFDGGMPFLYRARLLADGTLSGKFWAGNWAEDALTAHRDAHATLADPAIAAAAAAAGDAPFSFSFPDLDGHPVSLSDARFKDKVVIVALGGSWCPNCHDEAEFLVPLYRALKPRGLEIIYLEFEYFGDFPQAVAANRRFVSTFGIDWPVLIAGTSDKDEASRKLPRLGHVYAFPTTVVLDRKGRLRVVHSGFSGPATGVHYEEYRIEFTKLIDSLLAESG